MIILDLLGSYSFASKNETFKSFENFCKRIQNEKDFVYSKIRNDHGGEFENEYFKSFCDENGFEHNFSCVRTMHMLMLVVEKKNRSLQEIVRTMHMLVDKNLLKYF